MTNLDVSEDLKVRWLDSETGFPAKETLIHKIKWWISNLVPTFTHTIIKSERGDICHLTGYIWLGKGWKHKSRFEMIGEVE